MVDIPNTANVRYAYIEEAERGVTPDPAAFKQFNPVSDTFNPESTSVSSEEINPIRQRRSSSLVSRAAQGDLAIEMQATVWDDFFEGLFNNNWIVRGGDADVFDLLVGNTQHTYTIEKTFDGEPDKYQRLTGIVIDSFNLTMDVAGRITATLGCLGQESLITEALAANPSYEALTSEKIWDSSNNIQSFQLNGIDILSSMTSFSLTATNNSRQQPALGTPTSVGVGVGQFEVSGTMTVYFNSIAEAQLYQAQTVVPMVFKLNDDASGNDADSRYFQFTLPAVKITSLDTGIPGTNGDVYATLGFDAQIGTYTDIPGLPTDTSLALTRQVIAENE